VRCQSGNRLHNTVVRVPFLRTVGISGFRRSNVGGTSQHRLPDGSERRKGHHRGQGQRCRPAEGDVGGKHEKERPATGIRSVGTTETVVKYTFEIDSRESWKQKPLHRIGGNLWCHLVSFGRSILEPHHGGLRNENMRSIWLNPNSKCT